MSVDDASQNKDRGHLLGHTRPTAPLGMYASNKLDKKGNGTTGGLSAPSTKTRGWPKSHQTFLAIAELDTLATVMKIFGCSGVLISLSGFTTSSYLCPYLCYANNIY